MVSSPSLSAFKSGIQFGDDRLKVQSNQVTVKSEEAKTSFFGKMLSSIKHAFTPTEQRSMSHFKAALAEGTSNSTVKLLEKASKEARTELARLDELYNSGGYAKDRSKTLPSNPDPATVMEMRNRLSLVAFDLSTSGILTGRTVEKAVKMAELIEANKNDPMFQMMGTSKFVGYAMAVEKNVATSDDATKRIAETMSTCEKVALFGYTCADYAMINAALRNNTLDEGKTKFVDYVTSAMAKCPLNTENGGVTERALNDPKDKPNWAKDRYKNNETVTELAFVSTGQKAVGSTYKMTITGHGHDVSKFSAWPDEKEVLYPPGTRFAITVDASKPNEFHAKVLEPQS